MLAIPAVRHVVSNVLETSVAHGPAHVIALVHTSPEAVHVGLRWSCLFTEKGMSLHVVRDGNAGQAEHGWGEIDKAHHTIRFGARLVGC